VKKKGRIGSSFDDFLNIYEEVTTHAIKRPIAGRRDALIQEDQDAGCPARQNR